MSLLTKSKFMNGLQCPRLLWLSDRKQLPEIDLFSLHRMSQGKPLEKQVYKLFSDAADLSDLEFKENLIKTKEAIEQRKIIFEAGIKINNLFVRSDILVPVKGGWDLYEIKASNSLKKEYIPDLAFQKFVCEKAGLKIKNCYVYHFNKEYIKHGTINSKKLVILEDVTEFVNKVKDVEKNANKFLNIIKQKTVPDICISQNCNQPRECPNKSLCWGTLPKHNVLELTDWRLYWKLFDEGIIKIKDVPEDRIRNEMDGAIKKATDSNTIFVSKEHIKHFIRSLNYPLYYFDFESFDVGVPIFDKTRPWQKTPFQYSLHIEQKNGSLQHFEYLAEEGADPRIKLLEDLKTQIGTSGDVIVFNMSFEKQVLELLAKDFPEHANWLQNVIDRIVDLAVPFRNYYYYNPEQLGKYSIKKVLPAITGRSYDEIELHDGGDASIKYYKTHIDHTMDNKEEIRRNLLEYCGLDTEGMIWIVHKLKKLIK
ncbi:MAG: DUF2779 domain-containing protein [Nanoarchaeota archaeon]